jgi:hypothetical protein
LLVLLPGQVGDEYSFRYCSHQPTTFDSKIKGIFTTLKRQIRVHLKLLWVWDLKKRKKTTIDNDEDEDREREVHDFTGDGFYVSGVDSGDCNVFSERVFVESEQVL